MATRDAPDLAATHPAQPGVDTVWPWDRRMGRAEARQGNTLGALPAGGRPS